VKRLSGASLEKLARYKRSSLLQKLAAFGHKKFYNIDHRVLLHLLKKSYSVVFVSYDNEMNALYVFR
jgi:hypothetical protein